jgi:hypothetical protein
MAVTAYRNNKGFLGALATAGAVHGCRSGTVCQVITHVAWRGPSGVVAWHKGKTPKAMVTTAASLGIVPGLPAPQAMALALAALPKHKATTALLATVPKAAGGTA